MNDRVISVATADICDEYSDRLQVVGPGLQRFGGSRRCSGHIVTLLLEKGNTSLRALLQTPGKGRVIVADVGARYFSVVGDQLGSLAVENNWSGIIVNGYIRDTAALAELSVSVWALGTCPCRGDKKTLGEQDVAVEFAGVTFQSGNYLYADEDGVILAEEPFAEVTF